MIKAKKINCYELYHEGDLIGVYKESSTWNGLVELNSIGASEKVICGGLNDNIFSLLFSDNKELELNVISATPNLHKYVFEDKTKE